MQCKELLALLGEYVDGELSREDYATFEKHLCGCRPCEVVVDNVRQTIAVYRCGHRIELPSALQKQLRRVLRDRWEAKFPSRGG